MSISMIFDRHFKICKLGRQAAISQLANIGFSIQRVRLLNVSKLLLHKNACTYGSTEGTCEKYLPRSHDIIILCP